MKEEGVLQGWVGAFGEGSLGSGDGWCRWYVECFSKDVGGRSRGMWWWVGVEGVEGVMKYFQESFWVWVVFFDLGGDSDWVGVGWWCVP